ncbi:MAG: DNA topology modulation protein FlaR [Bdellovibrio sp.]|nr:DNA topology modulation protein FlaR [Bdellovibrio sp.]
MKIRIVGGSGSSKTYIGKELSLKHGIPHFDLDDILWDNLADTYGVKASKELRDTKLNEILQKDNWIIEGVYFGDWTKESFLNADQVILPMPSVYLQHWRIVVRWLKRRIGLVHSKKQETLIFVRLLKSLFELIIWNHRYNREDLQKVERLYPFAVKQS